MGRFAEIDATLRHADFVRERLSNNRFACLAEPEELEGLSIEELVYLVQENGRRVIVTHDGVSKNHLGQLIWRRINRILDVSVTRKGETLVTYVKGSNRNYRRYQRGLLPKDQSPVKSFRMSSVKSVAVTY